MKGDDIAERLLAFAVRTVKLAQALPKNATCRHIALQLLRSGTSAGANYEEARGAESRGDFTHKLGVAWKESREAWYWLRLIHRAELLSPSRVEQLLQEADELCRILARCRATVKRSAADRIDSAKS